MNLVNGQECHELQLFGAEFLRNENVSVSITSLGPVFFESRLTPLPDEKLTEVFISLIKNVFNGLF